MTETPDGLHAQVTHALHHAGLSAAIRSLSPVPPIVSPMCRAADWICARVETDTASLFVKLRAPDTADFITIRNAAAGARAAAAQGISPAVRFALPDINAMAVDLLPPPWREVRLSDLSVPEILQAVLSAKRQMHHAPPLNRIWNVFAEIEKLSATLPDLAPDLRHLIAVVRDIGDAFDADAADNVPCHADGVASNIMIGPAGDIRLVDFDCSGMADPHYDLGVVLNEICAVEADWSAIGALAYPDDTLAHIDRCRLYGVADDLLWGLWGLSSHARSQRTELEFLKYAHWRLLRCRSALRQPGHADRMKRLQQ